MASKSFDIIIQVIADDEDDIGPVGGWNTPVPPRKGKTTAEQAGKSMDCHEGFECPFVRAVSRAEFAIVTNTLISGHVQLR